MNKEEQVTLSIELILQITEQNLAKEKLAELEKLESHPDVKKYIELKKKYSLYDKIANAKKEELILKALSEMKISHPVNIFFYKGTYKMERVRRGTYQCLDTLVDRDSEEANITKYENLECPDVIHEIVIEYRDDFEKNNLVIYAPESNFTAIRAKYLSILLNQGEEKALKFIEGNYSKAY